jgi:hypothetical protein
MEHLPPWLRNLPLPPDPRAGSGPVPAWLAGSAAMPAAAAQSEPEPAIDDVPDWLRDLQQEAADPTSAPAPSDAANWLDDQPDVHAEEEQQTTTTSSGVRLPVGATDWLRSMGHEPDADEALDQAERQRDAELRAEDDAESGVPDWLRDLTPEDVPSVAEEEVSETGVVGAETPDWLSTDFPAPPEASTVSVDEFAVAPNDADGIPDWLRDIGIEPSDTVNENIDWTSGLDTGEPTDITAGADVPDWLRDVSSSDPTPVEAQSSAPTADDDMPDWLRADAPAPAPEPVAPTADDDMPDWLRADAPAPAPEPVAPTADDDMPDWLRADAPAPAPEPVAPTADDDMPDWLRADAPAATSESVAPVDARQDVPAWMVEDAGPPAQATHSEPTTDEIPDWLRGFESPAAETPPETPEPVAPTADDDMPDWLRGFESPAAETPPETPEPAPPTTDDMPDWLRGFESPAAETPPETPEPVAPTADNDMPDWLRGFESPAAETPPETPEPAPPTTDDNVPPWLATDIDETAYESGRIGASGNLPTWLDGEDTAITDTPEDLQPSSQPSDLPSDTSRRATIASEDAEGNDFLSGADLPDWLRPSEPERPVESEAGQTLDWLRRLGSSDTDTGDIDEVPATATGTIIPRPTYTRSSDQLAAIARLQQIVAKPFPEPATPPQTQEVSRWQRIGLERILYLLLIGCILAGIFFPPLHQPLQSPLPPETDAATINELIGSLDSEDVVLVAYEWGAQRSAELRPLEQVVTNRLIEQQVKLILVSTDVQGTILSFDLIEPLRAAGYNIDPDGRILGGRDYVLLGYQPGGELALRSLARDLRGELRSDFEGRDATQGILATRLDRTERISSIRDLGMIVVMADEPQDVQEWMEQVHRTAPEVPIAFMLPREAQPLAQPYLRLPNVYYLAGVQGALAFNTATGSSAGEASIVTGEQLPFAILTFVLILVGGGLVRAIIGYRRPNSAEVSRDGR